MSQRRKNAPDDVGDLIEQVDRALREAERLRNYARERSHRAEFWPDRRRSPRVPDTPGDNPDTAERA